MQLTTEMRTMVDEVISNVQQQLEKMIGQKVSMSYLIDHTTNVSSQTIEQIVCAVCDLPLEMIKKKTRVAAVLVPRQLAQWFLYHFAGMSKSAISWRFGCDHTSVLHNLKRVDDMLYVKDGHYVALHNQIEAAIKKLLADN